VANTVKPLIDRDFRTLPAREHTGILGSSMGGLISLYAFFSRPDVFGIVGALSPSLWFGQEAIFSYVQQAAFKPGRIYLDVGTHEGGDIRLAQRPPHKYTSRYLTAARRMRALLAAKGYAEGAALRYEEEEDALHNEAAWARRLPSALRFLLAPHRRAPRAVPAPAEPWWEF
jgi:predicted alpha/beta superfamily hydrolase